VPVLITHGQNDAVVSHRHGQLLAAARPDARVIWGKVGHSPLAVTERPELLAELLAAAKVRAGLPAADKGLAQAPVNSAL
jgi:pimeloyl-ACP methyl ester carboxylesterase